VKDYLSGFKVASIEKKVDKVETIHDESSEDEEEQKDAEDNMVFQRMLA
jgi:hypothetical protein